MDVFFSEPRREAFAPKFFPMDPSGAGSVPGLYPVREAKKVCAENATRLGEVYYMAMSFYSVLLRTKVYFCSRMRSLCDFALVDV